MTPKPYGVYTPGYPNDYTKIQYITALTGVKPAYVMWYVHWVDANSAFVSGNFSTLIANGHTPVLTWMPDNTAYGASSASQITHAQILAGTYDTYINSYANGIKALSGNVIIRLAHEMNGNWYAWTPGINSNTASSFVSMWQYVWNKFQAAGVTNVQWMFCPNVEYSGSTSFSSLYPGNGYVDLLGLDGYCFGSDSNGKTWQTYKQIFSASITDLLAVATKPLHIGEIGCVEIAGNSKADWVFDALQNINADGRIVSSTWFHQRNTQLEGFNFDNNFRLDSSRAAAYAMNRGLAGDTVIQKPFQVWQFTSSSGWYTNTNPYLLGTGRVLQRYWWELNTSLGVFDYHKIVGSSGDYVNTLQGASTPHSATGQALLRICWGNTTVGGNGGNGTPNWLYTMGLPYYQETDGKTSTQGNPPNDISTTITQAIGSTGTQTVSIGSSSGMFVGMNLAADTSTNQEVVTITAIPDSTHITAIFAKTHLTGVALIAAGSVLPQFWHPLFIQYANLFIQNMGLQFDTDPMVHDICIPLGAGSETLPDQFSHNTAIWGNTNGFHVPSGGYDAGKYSEQVYFWHILQMVASCKAAFKIKPLVWIMDFQPFLSNNSTVPLWTTTVQSGHAVSVGDSVVNVTSNNGLITSIYGVQLQRAFLDWNTSSQEEVTLVQAASGNAFALWSGTLQQAATAGTTPIYMLSTLGLPTYNTSQPFSFIIDGGTGTQETVTAAFPVMSTPTDGIGQLMYCAAPLLYNHAQGATIQMVTRFAHSASPAAQVCDVFYPDYRQYSSFYDRRLMQGLIAGSDVRTQEDKVGNTTEDSFWTQSNRRLGEQYNAANQTAGSATVSSMTSTTATFSGTVSGANPTAYSNGSQQNSISFTGGTGFESSFITAYNSSTKVVTFSPARAHTDHTACTWQRSLVSDLQTNLLFNEPDALIYGNDLTSGGTGPGEQYGYDESRKVIPAQAQPIPVRAVPAPRSKPGAARAVPAKTAQTGLH